MRPPGGRRWFAWLTVLVWAACMVAVSGAPLPGDAPEALRETHARLAPQLQHNPFGRPLVLKSSDASNRLTGDIYAEVDYPFALVRSLSSADRWCDVISLHINTKDCHVESAVGTVLSVKIGRKTAQDVDLAASVDFRYRVAALTPEYLRVSLNAKDGPMGTSDYQIELEAVALSDTSTFLHLTYSYSANFSGRLAMQSYLATLGRDKVGFTPIGKSPLGATEYVGGMRGLVERNAMRYYLAIDAYLDSLRAAPADRFERRAQRWFAATEQYARQLHEVERADYLSMKRAENRRQQASIQ